MRHNFGWVMGMVLLHYLLLTCASATATRLPSLTIDDRAIIERNEILGRLGKTNPQILRRVLDMITTLRPDTTTSTQGPHPGDTRNSRPIIIDSRKNPDVERLLGSSPEARYDLLQLLKRAGLSVPARPPTGK